MWMALAKKELREIAPICLLGLGIQSLIVVRMIDLFPIRWIPFLGNLIPSGGNGIPFVGDNYLVSFVVVSIMTLGLIVFRQFAWESHQGTYPFLFHRPMKRTTIFSIKILCGYGGFLFATGVPMIFYASWAATPGNVPGPFYWSMTEPFFQVLLLLLIPYLAAAVTILREARWYGSRLFPLVGAILASVPLLLIPFWQPPLGLALVAIYSALLFELNQSVIQSRDLS